METKNITEKIKGSSLSTESIEYEGGRLAYLHFNSESANPANNKLVVIPGFTQGMEVLEPFGEALGDGGRREVFVLDQPERNEKTLEKPRPFARQERMGIEQQTKALLAFVEQQGLMNITTDFVSNSFGALALSRAAEIAHQRGWKTFSSNEGARIFFISPAGANDEESLWSLGARFAKSAIKNNSLGKVLDPTGDMLAVGMENVKQDPPKTINEVRAIAKSRIDFEKLREAGVRPRIIDYADDSMMPYASYDAAIGKIFDKENEAGTGNLYLDGVSTLIDVAHAPKLQDGRKYPGAANFEEFKAKTGLSKKQAKQAWAHHYRAAEHNDMQFHPGRAARFILHILSAQQK